jgi:hypothetical protein
VPLPASSWIGWPLAGTWLSAIGDAWGGAGGGLDGAGAGGVAPCVSLGGAAGCGAGVCAAPAAANWVTTHAAIKPASKRDITTPQFLLLLYN